MLYQGISLATAMKTLIISSDLDHLYYINNKEYPRTRTETKIYNSSHILNAKQTFFKCGPLLK